MTSESLIMKLTLRLGLEKIAWALRRFHAPVHSDALVLEVGAGGNPYPRANVLLDAYEATRERHWAPLIADRPTVLGFGENLPFRDGAFDFVIAAHVLEHSADPEKFISELQRVARAGYIEVPDAFMERVNPYMDHRLEITVRDAQLIIRKKRSWKHDEEVVELYEDRAKSKIAAELIPRYPFKFHVRYYWEGEISYVILNPDQNANWSAPVSAPNKKRFSVLGRARQSFRDVLRQVFSQRSRNRSLDVTSLLRCSNCHGVRLKNIDHWISCGDCGAEYQVRKNVIAMNKDEQCLG